jgi:hypothetical protein
MTINKANFFLAIITIKKELVISYSEEEKKKLLETLNHFIVDIASPPENAHQDGSNAIIKGCMTI